jgi:mannose-1-phosphate guanylyltransferase
MKKIHAVVMAGGSGTRFWPASRQARPKQLLPLLGGRTLLSATTERLAGFVPADSLWVVTNPAQVAGVRAALPDLADDRLVVEPAARDTAPCIALAAAHVEAVSPGALMAVLPADHVIEPRHEFQRMLGRGAQLASDDTTLVTFGVKPDRPSTAYGYLQLGDPVDDRLPRAFRVVRFREKPTAEVAARLLAGGDHLWNSGIFVWSTAAIFEAMDESHAELGAAARQLAEAVRNGDSEARRRAFELAPKTSIDYAVLERSTRAVVVEAEIRWDDLGSFLTLGTIAPPDSSGNVAVLANGACLIGEESSGCVVYADGNRTIALSGAHDLVVVAVDDAVLVCAKERAAALKSLVERIRAEGRSDLL